LKCDKKLDWWLGLANLHQLALGSASPSVSKGFAQKVRKLKGQLPEGVSILLNPTNPIHDRLIGFGNDPDHCLWGIAGVANSLLSGLASLSGTAKQTKEIVIADWSKFVAPLIVSVTAAGQIERAYRPDPLSDDLLPAVREKSVGALGACPVCDRLFQRMLRDQKCDNRRCRDAYRQRVHRAKQAH
jgi:hypothetical protein